MTATSANPMVGIPEDMRAWLLDFFTGATQSAEAVLAEESDKMRRGRGVQVQVIEAQARAEAYNLVLNDMRAAWAKAGDQT